jgi:hypothetical protein
VCQIRATARYEPGSKRVPVRVKLEHVDKDTHHLVAFAGRRRGRASLLIHPDLPQTVEFDT